MLTAIKSPKGRVVECTVGPDVEWAYASLWESPTFRKAVKGLPGTEHGASIENWADALGYVVIRVRLVEVD